MTSLADREKLLSQLAFIHRRLTQTSQYFVDEFEIAKDSIVTITNMFNELKAQLDAEKAKSNEVEAEKEK